MGHYEVRTHSPILVELLNPQGTHGKGSAFLRLFLALLEIRDFEPDGVPSCQRLASARLDESTSSSTIAIGAAVFSSKIKSMQN